MLQNVAKENAKTDDETCEPSCSLQLSGVWICAGLIGLAQYVRVGTLLARNAAQNHVLNSARAAVQALRYRVHGSATLGCVRGFAAEEVHVATFNLDAIRRCMPYRANTIPGGGPADICIRDGAGNVLSNAQVKFSADRDRLRRLLRQPKYDGMQKIVPRGMEDPARRHTASLEYGGLRSAPLTVAQADAATLDPGSFLDTLRPSRMAETKEAALTGAVSGALLLGGCVALTAAEAQADAEKRGAWDGKGVRQASKVAAVGAVAGSASAAIGLLVGSAAVSGVTAAGAVGAYGAVARCGDDASCRRREVRAVAVAAGVALAAAAVCEATLGPTGVGAAACPLAAWVAAASVQRRAPTHTRPGPDASQRGNLRL